MAEKEFTFKRPATRATATYAARKSRTIEFSACCQKRIQKYAVPRKGKDAKRGRCSKCSKEI